jgi:hypothetical protein
MNSKVQLQGLPSKLGQIVLQEGPANQLHVEFTHDERRELCSTGIPPLAILLQHLQLPQLQLQESVHQARPVVLLGGPGSQKYVEPEQSRESCGTGTAPLAILPRQRACNTKFQNPSTVARGCPPSLANCTMGGTWQPNTSRVHTQRAQRTLCHRHSSTGMPGLSRCRP